MAAVLNQKNILNNLIFLLNKFETDYNTSYRHNSLQVILNTKPYNDDVAKVANWLGGRKVKMGEGTDASFAENQSENEEIATIFYKRGWVEGWGTGTTRMIGYCQRNGTPEPEFHRFNIYY